ncbi:hypothetical protein KP509_02G031400 [Ceratopteris richardii]|uniref:Uncharacterized protein n=1 Tax=Ceratopteris richardii TaxID=49495 RepID=A0A8T2VBN2_CERRI|nr:hypothetical protein KP509_02G031400 [Ceratopteris richardii]
MEFAVPCLPISVYAAVEILIRLRKCTKSIFQVSRASDVRLKVRVFSQFRSFSALRNVHFLIATGSTTQNTVCDRKLIRRLRLNAPVSILCSHVGVIQLS